MLPVAVSWPLTGLSSQFVQIIKLTDVTQRGGLVYQLIVLQHKQKFLQKYACFFCVDGAPTCFSSIHLLIMVMYCLKLTYCSSFQPLFYLVLQRTIFVFKTVCFKYDGCGLPNNSVHLWWNPLCFFSIPLSSFHSLAHNVHHFTGLSCTSARNVMEVFYLREGYRYLLCVFMYIWAVLRVTGIFSHPNALAWNGN